MKAVARKARKVAVTPAAEVEPRRHKVLAAEPYKIEDGVTYSLQSTFGDCRQACRWYLEGWRSAELKESLEFGSLMHRLLEEYGKGIRDGAVRSHADGEAVLARVADQWHADHVASGSADAGTIQQTEVVIAKARAVWPAYVRVYKDDVKRDLWLDVEGTFDVRWTGYRLRGRRDGIRRGKRDSLWLFETKTKSRIDDDEIMATLSFDAQSLFYLLANRIELEDRRVKSRGIIGVIYNVIRNPGERRLKGGTEPLSEYSARIAAKIAEDPAHYFKRYEATYTYKQVDAFKRRLLIKLEQFSRWLDDRDWLTYSNEAACSKKWNCNFLRACAADGDMRDYVRTGRLFEELED